MVLKHCFQGKNKKKLRLQAPLLAPLSKNLASSLWSIYRNVGLQLHLRARCSIFISRSSSYNKTIFWWRLAEPDEENEMLPSG